MVYGNAVGLPAPWLGWWWWGANLKVITPPYEFYYHRWLIIALGCGATRAAAWCRCLSLWCGPIWSSGALVRTLRTFYGVLLCHTGQTELRPWDRNGKKRKKKLMLINREEWSRQSKIKSHLWEYLLALCSRFYSSFSFKKKENDEASFTIKGMMVHARTSGERWT